MAGSDITQAKKAKSAKSARDFEIEVREPHHTESQIAVSLLIIQSDILTGSNTTQAKKAKAGKGAREIETRHHTESQIAAKKAKAAKSG